MEFSEFEFLTIVSDVTESIYVVTAHSQELYIMFFAMKKPLGQRNVCFVVFFSNSMVVALQQEHSGFKPVG